MWGENAGVKILWMWTIGTAGVLCTAVIKRRLEDMEESLKQAEISSEKTDEQIEGEVGTANDFKNN